MRRRGNAPGASISGGVSCCAAATTITRSDPRCAASRHTASSSCPWAAACILDQRASTAPRFPSGSTVAVTATCARSRVWSHVTHGTECAVVPHTRVSPNANAPPSEPPTNASGSSPSRRARRQRRGWIERASAVRDHLQGQGCYYTPVLLGILSPFHQQDMKPCTTVRVCETHVIIQDIVRRLLCLPGRELLWWCREFAGQITQQAERQPA